MQLLNELVKLASNPSLNGKYEIAEQMKTEGWVAGITDFIAAANPAAILAIAEYVNGVEEIRVAAEKLVRCKGRYHSEQNYRALAALFGVSAPDLPPIDGEHIADAGKMIPKGWRLMPDEPTAEMMKAMYQAQDMWPNAHCDNQREREMSFARPRYIAAIATAPEAPHD